MDDRERQRPEACGKGNRWGMVLSWGAGASPQRGNKGDDATSGSVISFYIRMGGGERSEPPGSFYRGKVGCGLSLLMLD